MLRKDTDYKIFWTEEAIQNLEEILDYLLRKWTQREVDNFKFKLSKQIDLIINYDQIRAKFSSN